MDNFTNSKSQYANTLADINPSRINIPRTQLASKTRPAPVAFITSGNLTSVNNTVIQKKCPQKRVSPHPSRLLRLYSANMESDRSKILPSSSKSLDPRSTGPCTPSAINYSIPAQHTAAAIGTVVGTDTNPFTPTSVSSLDLPRAGLRAISQADLKQLQSKTSSPLDKELPPKPVLREHDSPERRGIFDATDSASKSLNTSYPPLQPTQTGGESPSDIGSFKTTPSLHSAQENAPLDVEFGTAVAKTALRASASALDLHSPFPSKDGLLGEQIVRPLSVNYSISAPRISERRAASFGHVASQKNGSPIPRKQVSTKVNRHEFRGYEALSTTGQRRIAKASLARVEDTLYQPPKQIAKYGRPSSSNAYQKGFTTELPDTEPNNGDRRVNYENRALSNDDSSRRSIKYGVGATLRFSNDAHEVIMGGSIPKLYVALSNKNQYRC